LEKLLRERTDIESVEEEDLMSETELLALRYEATEQDLFYIGVFHHAQQLLG